MGGGSAAASGLHLATTPATAPRPGSNQPHAGLRPRLEQNQAGGACGGQGGCVRARVLVCMVVWLGVLVVSREGAPTAACQRRCQRRPARHGDAPTTCAPRPPAPHTPAHARSPTHCQHPCPTTKAACGANLPPTLASPLPPPLPPQTKAAYAANLRDLEAHRGALDAACEAILERETLMGAELEAILAAHPPAALPGDDDGNGSGNGPEGRQPAGALA